MDYNVNLIIYPYPNNSVLMSLFRCIYVCRFPWVELLPLKDIIQTDVLIKK